VQEGAGIPYIVAPHLCPETASQPPSPPHSLTLVWFLSKLKGGRTLGLGQNSELGAIPQTAGKISILYYI